MKIPKLYKTAFFCATTLASSSLPTFGTLLSYYNFDDETNGDQIGSNDGQVNSQTGYTVDTPDGSAKSLDLSGTGVGQDYVRLGEASPNSPDFGISATNSFTISMWVNYTSSERGIVTIKQDLTSGGGDRSGVTFGLNSSGNPFLGLIQSSGDDDDANSLPTFHDVTTDQVVATSTWTHMAVTYDSLTDLMQIYVDGVAATTYTDGNAVSSMTATGGSLTGGVGVIDFVDANGSFTGFGASGNAPQHSSSAGDFTCLFYDGLLDEVGIWDNALNSGDIAALAAGASPPDLGGGIPPLKITAVDLDFPASSVTLTWTSRPGRIYVLESSPDFRGGNWAEIDDNIPSQGTTTTYLDMNLADPAIVPKLFFRIRELP